MRLSVESRVRARAPEVGALEDLGHLVSVGVNRAFGERPNEVRVVRGRLAHLNGIGLRTRGILRGYESLTYRKGHGRLIVVTAACDEANCHDRCEE